MATAEATRSARHSPSSESPLRCLVVTPERTVLDERAEFVAVPLYDGELGILKGRAPLVGRVGQGLLRTDSAGRTRRLFVDGGFIQVRDNVVTLLTSRALSSDEIDPALAQQELQAARALSPQNALEHEEKSRALARARALVRLASA